jgi:hypothetical protein
MKCPKCDGTVKEVIYGLPSSELMDDDSIIIGGCIIDEDSKHYICDSCGKGFDSDEIHSQHKVPTRYDSLIEIQKAIASEFNPNDLYPDLKTPSLELEEEYRDMGLKIESVGGVVPVQAHGKIGYNFFYFRYRGDSGSLSIGSQAGTYNVTSQDYYYRVENYTGDSMNGYLSPEEFKDIFSKLLEMHRSAK